MQTLAALYEPLGCARAELWRFAGGTLAVGRLTFAHVRGDVSPYAVEQDGGVVLVWGGPVPPFARSPAGALGASASELREQLDRTVAVIAVHADRLLVAGAASGATTMYASAGPEATAWATHAAGASILGRGRVEIAWEAVPEYLAADSVGGTDSHLRGVRAFPSAWSATVRSGTPREAAYWPSQERWQPCGETEAISTASDALLRSVDARLTGVERVHCALTGGLDSRVVAVALRELGLPTYTFTHGTPDWPDVQRAAEVAEALGFPHRALNFRFNSDSDARKQITEAALWADGLSPTAGFGVPDPMPLPVYAAVTGNGGETGRAWYYRWLAGNYRAPSVRQLARALGHLHQRIAGADSAIHRELDERLLRRVTEAQGVAHVTGWRSLDVLYEEWRGRRFVRARLPRLDAYAVAGLSAVDLNRALVSLPLRDRLTDGFHRAFIAARAPSLSPPPPGSRYRRFVPPPIRRARHRLRSVAPPPPRPWSMAGYWPRFQDTRHWITDSVLADAELRDNLGDAWCRTITDGFLADEDHATGTALRLTALIALRDQACNSQR